MSDLFSRRKWAVAAAGALLLLPVSARLFAADLPPQVLLVARAMQTNRDLLKPLPFYTCLETISRSRPGLSNRKARNLDVVQVDVGVGSDQEIYSWPGAETFSSEGLFALVGHGLLSSGVFHTFAQNLFLLRHGIVRAAGESVMEGRAAFHFTYAVPSLESRWEIRWSGFEGLMGEKGEFWVDKRDFTLLRLAVHSDDIPASVPLQTVEITIDYEPEAIGGAKAILPVRAHLLVIDSAHKRYENTTAFSHCHLFQTESKLTNSSEDLQDTLRQYEKHRGMLPAGITLRVALETPVDAKQAKVGDSISARLEDDVSISKTLIAPRGALLKGHIREFQEDQDLPNTYVVGVEFDTLSWENYSYAFLADIVSIRETQGVRSMIFNSSSIRREMASGMAFESRTEELFAGAIPGAATFFLKDRYELPKGFEMTWRTRSLRHE